VRHLFSCLSYDTPEQLHTLDHLYSTAHYYKNLRLPVAKLKHKSRVGATVRRVYDGPITPHARVLASPDAAHECRDVLRETYGLLDLVDLRRQIAQLQDRLARTVAALSPSPCRAIRSRRAAP
jgi:hypothetical protein